MTPRTPRHRRLPGNIVSVAADPWIRMMLYGWPGTGKTRFAGSTPRSLILRPAQDHVNSIPDHSVQTWVLNNWSDMDEAREFLRHEASQHFDWVWMDSISLWQDVGLDDIWQGVVAEKPHRAKWGADKGEYGRNMDRLSRWYREVTSYTGFHFGVTAHPFEATTPDGSTIFMPYVQGKNMSPKICGYMNMVGYLDVNDKGTRVLRTNLTEDYFAKDQFDAFPRGRLVSPTIPKLEAAVKAAIASRAKAAPKRPTRRTRQKV